MREFWVVPSDAVSMVFQESVAQVKTAIAETFRRHDEGASVSSDSAEISAARTTASAAVTASALWCGRRAESVSFTRLALIHQRHHRSTVARRRQLDQGRPTIVSPFEFGVLDLAMGDYVLRRAIDGGDAVAVSDRFGSAGETA